LERASFRSIRARSAAAPAYSAAPIPASKLAAGVIFGVHTNGGNYAKVIVIAAESGSLPLQYTTFAEGNGSVAPRPAVRSAASPSVHHANTKQLQLSRLWSAQLRHRAGEQRGAGFAGQVESNQAFGNGERRHHDTGAVLRVGRCRRGGSAVRHAGGEGNPYGNLQREQPGGPDSGGSKRDWPGHFVRKRRGAGVPTDSATGVGLGLATGVVSFEVPTNFK